MKATMRLTYVFLAAYQMGSLTYEEVQEDILNHLETAQDKLGKIWGQSELERLHKAGHTLANLSESWQRRLSNIIGEESFIKIKGQPLNQLSPSDHERKDLRAVGGIPDECGSFTRVSQDGGLRAERSISGI